MNATKGLLCAVALAAAGMAPGGAALAWPDKPVEVIVPYGAGGGSDAMVRIFQKAATDNDWLGQPMVVKNIGGAGGRTGSRQAMEAEPDGYTFLSNHLTLMTGQATGVADFGYRDFDPVAATGAVCMVVAVPEASPHQTLAELMEAAKSETFAYGANLGALNHMAGLSLQNTTPGVAFNFVQTGGDAKNFVALSGNVLPVAGVSAGQYRSGEGGGVRGLAILADTRDPNLPDLPTAREQGFDTDFCFEYWWFAPKGTSRAAIDGMADMLEKAMADEAVLAALDARSVRPVFRRGASFGDFLEAQWARTVPLAEQAVRR